MSINYLTRQHKFLTSRHNDLTSQYSYLNPFFSNNYFDILDNAVNFTKTEVNLSDLYVDEIISLTNEELMSQHKGMANPQ